MASKQAQRELLSRRIGESRSSTQELDRKLESARANLVQCEEQLTKWLDQRQKLLRLVIDKVRVKGWQARNQITHTLGESY